MASGSSMPPMAPTTGAAITRGSESSPIVISRLISRPMTKKKRTIATSFTQK